MLQVFVFNANRVSKIVSFMFAAMPKMITEKKTSLKLYLKAYNLLILQHSLFPCQINKLVFLS